MVASYDSTKNAIDMVPGSAGKGYKASSLPVSTTSGNIYPGVSNQGLGGWNQVGCLIYEVITSKNRPSGITENKGSSNLWVLSQNWAQYQTYWPTMAKAYYDLGTWYCKPGGSVNIKTPPLPPCQAFPCPLGSSGNSLSQVNNLIQT